MRLLPAGESALLVDMSAPQDVLPLIAALRRAQPSAVTDLVPAERTILVGFDPGLTTADRVAAWVRSTEPVAAEASSLDEVEIAVRYDGEDLAEVAGQLGLDAAGLIAAHSEVAWTVAFSGFAPGFAYLRPPDGRLAIARRDSPRPRVPPGSVALAAGYTGIYPRASPGGWHLIGHTDAPLWDASRWDDGGHSPALLQPGARVRFTVLR